RRPDARAGPLCGRAAILAPEVVGRVPWPALRGVLPDLLPAIDGHVEQLERRHDRFGAAAGRLVREEDAVVPTEETGDVATAGDGGVVDAIGRVPRMGVAHELPERRQLFVYPFAEHGKGDAARLKVRRVLEVPDRDRAAFALLLERLPVVPHVLVD